MPPTGIKNNARKTDSNPCVISKAMQIIIFCHVGINRGAKTKIIGRF